MKFLERLKSQNSDTASNDRAAGVQLKKHLQDIVRWTNTALDRFHIEARLGLPKDYVIFQAVNTIDAAFYTGQGEILHSQQVNAGVETIGRLALTDSWKENIISGPQAGKATTIGFLNDLQGHSSRRSMVSPFNPSSGSLTIWAWKPRTSPS